jgi:hypothetical protein
MIALAVGGCVTRADEPLEPGPAPSPSAPPASATEDVGPTKTLQQALGEFGACMSLEEWITTGIYKMYKAATEEGQECQACHSDGSGGVTLSDDVLATFQAHQRFPAIMRLVTGTVDERGNFKSLVPSNRYIDKGIDTCLAGLACHPKFTLPVENEIQADQKAVSSFVQRTLDRWLEGECNAYGNP